MDTSVVAAKVRRPRVAADAIARDGLRAQLDAGLLHPVVLVTAPAGFGKTWLVADWLDGHAEVAQGWVSVDRYDNDPMRLWRHILEAVAQSELPEAATEALRLFAEKRVFPALPERCERARTAITTMTPTDHTNLADQWAYLPEPHHESPVEFTALIDATIAYRRGDVALALATNSLLERPSESGWVEAVAGEMSIYRGRSTEGVGLMKRWNDFSFSAENPVISNRTAALTVLAWAAYGEGRLTEAESLADQGVEVMRTNGLADQPQAAVATVPLAWVSYERGDLDTAHTLITSVLERLEHYGEVPAYVFAHTLLARIHHARGDRSSAAATLETARLSPTGRPITGHFADLVAYERARLALLNGNLPGAENALPDWPTRIKTGATTMTEHLTLTRLAIATGDDPTTLFDAPPDGVDVTPAHQIELHKLRALAALRHGDEDAALEHLTEAMTTATHTGHRQTFLDDYPTLGILLDNAAAMTGHRLNPIPSTATTTIDPAAMAQLTEPLTERELEVLRLLPSHLTYREIAEQLYVSTNTVKSYNKNIYRKLNADTRNQAVTNATTLGLLS